MRNLKLGFRLLIFLVITLLLIGGCNKPQVSQETTNTTVEHQTTAVVNATPPVVIEEDPKESAEFEKNAYRTLQTMKSMYVILMSTSGDLYRNGDLGEEARTKIVDLGNVYYGSYMTLVKALEEYHKFKNEESKLALALQLYKTIKDYNTILDYFNSVTSGIKGVQQWKNL